MILLFFISYYFVSAEPKFRTTCRSFGFFGAREVATIEEGCEEIYGNVWILNKETPFEELKRVFSSVRVIHGCVSIYNIPYTNLSFFANLEHIYCKNNEIQAILIKETFVIMNNANLARLEMPKFKSVTGPNGTLIEINGSPGFCFAQNDYDFIPFARKIYPKCDGFELCKAPLKPNVTDGSQLPDGCVFIQWNIVLEGNIDEKYLRRLGETHTVIGSIIIRNTNITVLDLLQMEVIRPAEGEIALTIENNINLLEVKLGPNVIIDGDKLTPWVRIIRNPMYSIEGKMCELAAKSFTDKRENAIENCGLSNLVGL